MAGLLVGRALGCSGCLGVGSFVPTPHVPGHPISVCDVSVNDSVTVGSIPCSPASRTPTPLTGTITLEHRQVHVVLIVRDHPVLAQGGWGLKNLDIILHS